MPKAHHDIDSQIQVVLTSSFDLPSDFHITKINPTRPAWLRALAGIVTATTLLSSCGCAAHVISWTTYDEYGSGVEVADDYNEESPTAFKKMEALRCGVLQNETTVHLVVVDVPGLFYELQAIQTWVTRYKIPWHPDLDARGTLQCSWAAFHGAMMSELGVVV
jgi:hypothetical protein